MGPINVNVRFQTLCIILSILSCFARQSYADPHVNKDFYLFEIFSKDDLSSKVGAKQNPSISSKISSE